MVKTPEFPFVIHALEQEDGGGWLVTFPDLPGCTADGDTIEQAVLEAADAETAWLAANSKWGGDTPRRGRRVVAQLSEELLESLQREASKGGVSLDRLLSGIISQGLSQGDAHSA